MAQRIEQFQKRTPSRYHRPSRRDQERGAAAGFSCLLSSFADADGVSVSSSGPSPVRGHLKLTQPQSPCLMTRQRSRPTAAKSSAELEAEELQQLQR